MDVNAILERLRSFDSWEIYRRKTKSVRIKTRGGTREGTFMEEKSGMAIRAIKGKKILFFHASGWLDPENADPSTTRYLNDEDYSFPGASELPEVNALDPKIMEDPEVFGEEFSKMMEEAAFSLDPRIKAIRQCWYEESVTEDSIINSHGINWNFRRTNASAYIELKASGNGEEEMGYSYRVGVRRDEISPEEMGREAAERAISTLGGKPIKTGTYTTLLKNEVVSEMLSFFAPSLLGENVIKGKSFLRGKLGEKVLSSSITMVDTGLEGAFPSPFDGEGTPSKRNVVVEKGVLKMFLYDILWAKKAGKVSTGNSVRSGDLSSPPQLSIMNLMVKKGSRSPNDILSGETDILIINDVMGLHLANPVTGEFSLGASGIFIGKEGRFGVKSITITGNILKLLERAAEVFNDTVTFGRISSPSILVDGISVVGA